MTVSTAPGSQQNKNISSLLDSGARRSVISHELYDQLALPTLKQLPPMRVHGASGQSLHPLGIATLDFELYGKKFRHEFIVCALLHRPIILGTDFMRKHNVMTGFMDGMKTLIYGDRILAEEYDCNDVVPVYTCRNITIPPRHTAVSEVTVEAPRRPGDHQPRFTIQGLQYINPSLRLREEEPNLYLPDMALRNVDEMKNPRIKMPFTNLDSLQAITIPKGTIVAYAVPETDEINFVKLAQVKDIIEELDAPKYRNWIPPSPKQNERAVKQELNKIREHMLEIPKDTAFLVSPADVDPHRRVELQDAEVSEETRQHFKEMCERYPHVFSKSNTDIGRTKLVTMDIQTGDHPPIIRNPIPCRSNTTTGSNKKLRRSNELA